MRCIFLTVFASGVIPMAAFALPSCPNLLPDTASSTRPRLIEANDLLKLRDIGPTGLYASNSNIVAVSPNGKSVAFQIRQADPVNDRYCLGMFVLPLTTNEKPQSIDQGGEFIRGYANGLRGFSKFELGVAAPITPKWSPDGKWVAFLRRDNNRTQVWRAATDRQFSESVTNATFDVEDFAWSDDGDALIYSGRPGLEIGVETIAQEGRSGFLYDDRYQPLKSSIPFLRGEVSTATLVVGASIKVTRTATDAEKDILASSDRIDRPVGAIVFAKSLSGRIAWTVREPTTPASALPQLKVQNTDGREFICAHEFCSDATSMWWTTDGRALIFQRSEGWAKSQTALYRWRPGEDKPRRLLVTDDVLLGCQLSGVGLVCVNEASTQPRRLVAVDTQTGRISILFDPNPEFKNLHLGKVQRLHTKNSYGVEAFADFVLPPNHQPGQKHPLIVVGYESRGFLRGGTGDEYPIQLFAARGFAVLSYQRPKSWGAIKGAVSVEEIERLNREDWIDRRSVQSSLETALDESIALGVVDPERLGITGLSDAMSTARFAMINSNRFKVAAFSSCSDDRNIMALSGPVSVRAFRNVGAPPATENNDDYWHDVSLRVNAKGLDIPLLMQLPDAEYLCSLEDYMALSTYSKPVEMYVFPNEYHTKWHPAHRQAIYERNIDWFDFWLNRVIDNTPEKSNQYARWKKMKDGV